MALKHKYKSDSIEKQEPMLSKYHSNTFNYYNFQPEAVEFMYKRDKAILALPTGTGKTAVSLSAFAKHKEDNKNFKLLFITDKSVVIQVKKTIDEFFTLKADYIYGDSKSTRNKIYNSFKKELDVLILNYAMVRQDVEDFQQIVGDIGPKNIIMICDEANYVANSTSKIHTIIRNISKHVAKSYFLTATVSKGKLEDYYNIIRALGKQEHNPQEFIESFGNYGYQIFGMLKHQSTLISRSMSFEHGDNYMIRFGLSELPKDKYTCINETDRKKVVNNTVIMTLPKSKWSKPRRAGTVVEVIGKKSPAKKLVCSLTSTVKLLGYKNLKLFKKLYNNVLYSKSKKEIAPDLPMFTKMLYHVEEDKKTHTTICKLYEQYGRDPMHSQLNIALSNPGYFEEYCAEGHKNEKITELLYIIENLLETDEKAIIYHSSKKTIDFIYKVLTEKHYTCSRITGDIVKTREQEKQDFINHNQFMLITDAGGVGVDSLQISGNIIFMGMPNTGGQLQQICGRISRINTKHTKLNLHFILTKDSYDTDKYRAVMSQLRLMHNLDKNSVDGGILDSEITESRTEMEADNFIKEQIWSRRNQYK